MSAQIFILLGSSLGDRQENLDRARQEISRSVGEIITTSSIYKTAAWGNTQQPDFYNQVIEIRSAHDPEKLILDTQRIEQKMGRTREEKWGPRIIDIDILFYGDSVISAENLTIPHPEIANRRFTLLPLAEIASDFIHTILKKSVLQLLEDCKDDLPVEKIV
jgi:2-amino-4-hydroxy-6-hydroxymethyldihydropteridine diphosphokinase